MIKKNKNINLDLIRVISMIFVVLIHILELLITDTSPIKIIVRSILYTCNGMFFMLSGYLNLDKRIKTKKDYKDYYLKKTIRIIIPFIIISFFITIWDSYIINHKKINILKIFRLFYINFISGNISAHLWFMYPLIGYLLSAPFLGKLFQKLSNYELNLLFKISIIWNIFSIYLTKNFNIAFSFNGWLLSGWTLLFFSGYYIKRITKEINQKKLYLIGIIGLIITIICSTIIPNYYKNSYDLSIVYVIYTISVFVFLKERIKINNYYLKVIIRYLSKYSYFIYLFHFNVLKTIINIIKPSSNIINTIIVVLSTIIISLLLSISFDKFIYIHLKRIYYNNILIEKKLIKK